MQENTHGPRHSFSRAAVPETNLARNLSNNYKVEYHGKPCSRCNFMWMRNLLFLGVVGGAVCLLGAGLLPPSVPAPITSYDTRAYRADDFRAIVARVDASFPRQGVAGPAPDLTVARRLALGLAGTIPSLEEIRQFEQLPPEQRLPWWIDHLLQDRRHADYFAERLARAFVGAEDGPFLLYRRRRFVTYLSDQLAQNRPYDALVRELIASEGLWTDRPATNFVNVTLQPDRKNQPDPERLAARVTRAFLGLRLDCAQCHNHPFAEWKRDDFQGLAAFFAQTELGLTGVHDGDGVYVIEDRATHTKKVVAARVPFDRGLLPAEGSRRQRLAAWVTSPKNSHFARATVNRVWALLLGRPLVEPVDNLDTDASLPEALTLLANDFAEHGFDLRRLVRVIASTEVFRRDSKGDHEPTEENVWAVFPLTRLRPEQVAGSILQAGSVTTLDSESHILIRLMRQGSENDFVRRYGDSGEDELEGRGGTIPQRLLLMNGTLVHEKTKESIFNAATRIAWMAPDDDRAIEVAYLTVLTRRPTDREAAYFKKVLAEPGRKRTEKLEDLFWALLNSTELSWNH